jgi:hypothetical protein
LPSDSIFFEPIPLLIILNAFPFPYCLREGARGRVKKREENYLKERFIEVEI